MSTIVIRIIIISMSWMMGGADLLSQYQIVDHCPSDQNAWQVSTEKLNCPSLQRYHCIRIWNYSLVETCTNSVSAQERDGCPWLDIREDKGTVKFAKCQKSVSGCPGDNLRWFSSDQVFKFPGCFTDPNRTRILTSVVTSSQQATTTIPSTYHIHDVSNITALRPKNTPKVPSSISVHSRHYTRELFSSHETTRGGFTLQESTNGLPNNIILYGIAGGGIIMFLLITILIVAVICLWRKNKSLRISGGDISRQELGVECPQGHDGSSQYDSIPDVRMPNSPSHVHSTKEKADKRNVHVYDEAGSQKDIETLTSEDSKMTMKEVTEKFGNEAIKDKEAAEKYIPLERVEESSYRSLKDGIYDNQGSQSVTNVSEYEEPVSNKYEKLLPHRKMSPEFSGEKGNREYQDLKEKSSSESDSSQVDIR